MRETIIENKWAKVESCGKLDICTVYFHYTDGNKPYVTFSGYNPFPFFCGKEKLYTTKKVFNEWMSQNDWQQLVNTSDTFSYTTIIKQG